MSLSGGDPTDVWESVDADVLRRVADQSVPAWPVRSTYSRTAPPRQLPALLEDARDGLRNSHAAASQNLAVCHKKTRAT